MGLHQDLLAEPQLEPSWKVYSSNHLNLNRVSLIRVSDFIQNSVSEQEEIRGYHYCREEDEEACG